MFLVEKTELKRLPNDVVSSGALFDTGNAYIIIHSIKPTLTGTNGVGGAIERTIFYWIGAKSSTDKATVASMKAVELKRGLGGVCTISREEEGQESGEFLYLLGGELQVVEGTATDSALKRAVLWSDMPPMAYTVCVMPLNTSGSKFTVSRVPFEETYPGKSGIAIVDNRRGTVYVYQGSEVPFLHQSYGLEAATCLKADCPKGARVEVLKEGDELPEELRSVLPGLNGEVGKPVSASGTTLHQCRTSRALYRIDATDKASSERRATVRLSLVASSDALPLMEAMRLDGRIQQFVPEIPGVPPSLFMLSSGSAFILDCFSEIFVWYGLKADRAVRRSAVRIMQQIQRGVSLRPQLEDQVVHMQEGKEPFLFRVKFKDWGMVNSKAQQNSLPSNFFEQVRTIATTQYDRDDDRVAALRSVLENAREKEHFPSSEGDTEVNAAGCGSDSGEGPVLLYRVTANMLKPLDEAEYGNFNSDCSYVILYGFCAGGKKESDHGEENIAPLEWKGLSSSSHDPCTDSEEVILPEESHESQQGKAFWREEPVFEPPRTPRSTDDDHSKGATSDDRGQFMIYFWSGSQAKASDWVSWSLGYSNKFFRAWKPAMEGGTIPQVRVTEGREPSHFRRIFSEGHGHGRLVIHNRYWRRRNNPEQRTVLYSVQRMRDGTLKAFQTPPTIASFHSRGVFICVKVNMHKAGGGAGDSPSDCCQDSSSSSNTEALYFWTGRLAPFSLQDDAARVLFFIMESLAFPGDFPVKTIDEGEAYGEEAALWDELCNDLGGECPYATWDSLPDDYDPENEDGEGRHIPQLFVSETGSGQVNLEPLPCVQQCNLYQGGVALLQCYEALYIWKGSVSSTRQYELILRAAREFRRDGSVVLVSQGSEPAEFCAHFQTWSDRDMNGMERSSAGWEGITCCGGYEDIYEKRISMLDTEGKLGDIRQLRGRVLGDQEAKNYWSRHTPQKGEKAKAETTREGDPATTTTAAAAAAAHFLYPDLCERSHRRRGEAGSTKGVLRPTVEKGHTLSPKFVQMRSRFESKTAFQKGFVRSSYDPAYVLVSLREAIESGTVKERRWGKENIKHHHHLSSVERVVATQQQSSTKQQHEKGQPPSGPCSGKISAATSDLNDEEGNRVLESVTMGETVFLSDLAAGKFDLKPPKRGEGVGPHAYYDAVLKLNKAVNEHSYNYHDSSGSSTLRKSCSPPKRHRSTRSAVTLSLKEATAAARWAGMEAAEAFGGVRDGKYFKKKASVANNIFDDDELSPRNRYYYTPRFHCPLLLRQVNRKPLIMMQPRLSRKASVATCEAAAFDRETVLKNFCNRLTENTAIRQHRRMRSQC